MKEAMKSCKRRNRIIKIDFIVKLCIIKLYNIKKKGDAARFFLLSEGLYR